MSVYRQLIGVISTVILLLASLWITISIHTDKSTIIKQLQIQAQSGATSLAISMTEVIKQNDRSRLGALFNAVSDLGYYQQIYFIDNNDNRLIERSFSIDKPEVPSLFIETIDLPPIEARAAVSAGWTRIGDVVVIMSLRDSYEQLWQSTLRKTLWSFAMAIVGILLTSLIIRLRLKAVQRPNSRH
ncbi:MAG: LapD/MoxY N-terminal periplasmic domain-containing protein [Porticoccaceae bacterium]|nr:LapD/MoxY N-terminal periplasmic domain-containing protein [Porticoccaceae bacterium]